MLLSRTVEVTGKVVRPRRCASVLANRVVRREHRHPAPAGGEKFDGGQAVHQERVEGGAQSWVVGEVTRTGDEHAEAHVASATPRMNAGDVRCSARRAAVAAPRRGTSEFGD